MLTKLRTTARQFWSYLRAISGGESVLSRQKSRLEICRECPARVEIEGRAYCGACGCPKSKRWKRSELSNKVKYLKSECPLGKWPD